MNNFNASVLPLVFLRFSAGDDSGSNQTAAGSISQGSEWEHEQSFTGSLWFFCPRMDALSKTIFLKRYAVTCLIKLTFVLKEDLADLKGQITLYESAVKHGVIAFNLSSDWENHLSESCMDLGLKKTNRKNDLIHRYTMSEPLRGSALWNFADLQYLNLVITTFINHEHLTFPAVWSVPPWLTCQTPSCPKMKLCSCCELRCSAASAVWRGSGRRSVSCRRSFISVRVEWTSCRLS